ncbi:MAG: hypothetical protein U1E05_27310 [Patescibacteria group bacterium]|nr:hypothetical protein [Patescibacteria group bacterium]
MNVRHVFKWCLVAALAALGTNLGLRNAICAQPGPPDNGEGVQVLTRGPIHEAFAATVTFDPEPGILVPNAPPVAIEELPPDERPEGANVTWIPGYWGWDDERSDFLWVSGVWRALPPGRQWVPGYWGKSAQGYQWISGYWPDAEASEVEYLPEPPATVEDGPNIAASSADQTWLPGCWIWQQDRYVWRPGFWADVQSDWVWIPAHYVWAPRGYVFVDGYWDYSIARRGVLFAPVYFNSNVVARQGFSYSPRTVIDLGVFTDHLFLRPQYRHYYFGDYYAANYRTAGFHPWFSINTGRFGYDPFYAHQRWQHRQDGQWEHRVAADFQNRRDHETLRPSRTWTNQVVIGGGGVGAFVRDIVGQSLNQAPPRRDSTWRFQPIDQAEQQRLRQHGQEVHRFREQRHQWETGATAPVETQPNGFAPGRSPLPRSPIAARPVTELGDGHTPPKMYEFPKPDPNVAARARMSRSPRQP